jgi:ribose 1,5-bisphosphokinase
MLEGGKAGGWRMLVLVVGPSGAGKDTLLLGAKAALAGNPRYRFVRRVITRPADAGAEDHEAVTEPEFATRDFALQWQAHGLRYGIPADIAADIARGLIVIASVSRLVIEDAAHRFPVKIVEITAPPEVLGARLAARGREDAGNISARLARVVALPDSVPVETILNDRTPAEGIARLLAVITEARSPWLFVL